MKTLTTLVAAFVVAGTAAFADTQIMIHDSYARAAGKMAKAGGAFMQIMNKGDTDDRLIDARSPFAKKVELHTHKDLGDGVMKMVHVEEGFAIPAGATHSLARGGDHVMFMGLTETFEQGKMIPVTLVFEKAGEIEIEIPVDLERQPDHGAMKMQHKHSND